MKVDIAIMTIREDEFTAVRRRFQTERRRIPNGRTYLIGEVKTEKQTYTIAIARCSEQGTDASQRLAHSIIHNLDPQLILVVGIAGGVPRDEFTLGDVVVSTRIVNPNVDAWHPDGTTDYTTRGGPPHPLVENIVSLLPGEPGLAGWTDTIQLKRPTLDPEQQNVTGDDEWREKVRKSLNWHFGEEHNRDRPPTFTIGHMLSSNHLVKDPARLREILKTHRSILAVEMEVAGVYEAAQGIDRQYPVMAIRGISDMVGLQRDSRWTEYACQTAAAFMYAFIMTDPLEPPPDSASFQMLAEQRTELERKAAEQQAQTEREIASDNQRQEALQAYFAKMSELILEKDLCETNPGDMVRIIARTLTLTLLSRLDNKRKRSVVQFLYESNLIKKDKCIVDLAEADLSGADLGWASLPNVNLSHADLSNANFFLSNLIEANLSGAILSKAHLSKASLSNANLIRTNLTNVELREANLSGVDLREANLYHADLRKAILRDANLNGDYPDNNRVAAVSMSEADLGGADLTGANLKEAILLSANLRDAIFNNANLTNALVTNEQLEQAKSLAGATMLDGSVHP